MLSQILAVGSGGFIGAVSRYAISACVYQWAGRAFPWATLAINLLGCFAIGCAVRAFEEGLSVPSGARLFFVIGLLGSFTTFSAFGMETVQLFRTGNPRFAIGYVAASVLLGLACVELGMQVWKWIRL